jgi:ferredoxin-type protein NapH
VSRLHTHRYLLLRRLSQAGILCLFWLGAHLHLGWLTGDLSAARLFRTVPLSDPFAVLQILATGRPIAATALLGAAIVLLFYLAVGGRGFCAWVCPINPVTDLAGWLRRRTGIERQFRVARGVRFAVMGLALALSALLGVAAFEWVSPIAMLHRELIFEAGLGLLVIPWILLLAFYSLVGRLSLLRVGFARDRCDRCGDCVEVCPEPQVIRYDEIGARGLIDDGDCLNCGRCLEVCPRDAFAFTWRFHRPMVEA